MPHFARLPHAQSLRRSTLTLLSLAALCWPQLAAAVQFGPVTDLQTGIGFTTVLTLGPEDPNPGTQGDGCIYAVHGGNGSVSRICFDDAKSVTSNTIVVDINGAGGVNNVLGIAIDPASDPSGEIHLYLGYSDTNSAPFEGKIARAVSTDGGTSYAVDEDFIIGLGRSAFDHQTNGLDFGPDGCLYISQGNNSNAGYDNAHAESRLSSAILRACFKGAGGAVDPAFDRECVAPGDTTRQEACGVEVYASGLRNPYDIVWHSNGRLYNADNDANQGFRDNCNDNANTFGCTCQTPPVEPIGDELNLIEPGFYYGSPNPYRANPAGLQCNGGTDAGDFCTTNGDCGGGGTCENLSSLCTDSVCGDDAQCYYFGYNHGPAAGEDPNDLYREPIAQIGALLDGLTEYKARFAERFGDPFCSDWNGDLLVTGGPGSVRRFSLSSDGLNATHEGTGNLNGITGLDVVVGPDGTVFAANLNAGSVQYMEPVTQGNPLAADFFTFCAPGEACVDGACANDTDNDGIADALDPCPSDARNLCVGSVAIDGNTGNPIRINANTGVDACSGTKVDCNGDTWFGDFGYNQAAGAFTCDLPGGCPLSAAPVFGCTDTQTEDLFRCEHWDDIAAPELIYDFDVPNGDYLVNLLFMNAFSGSANPGDRVFDVHVEGAPALVGFDQVVAAGGSGIPVTRAIQVTVSDGNGLQIEFVHGAADNPAIKAIEVLSVAPECVVDADCDDSNLCTDEVCSGGTCQITNNSDPCDDGVSCTSGDVCAAGACSGASNCAFGEICDPQADQCVLPAVTRRINVNGPAQTGTDYPGSWSADPGNGGVCGPNAFSIGGAINGTVDDVLFQGEVWGNPVSCSVDDGGVALPAGAYTVNLYFAEIYFGPGCAGGGGGNGARVFDVILEGQSFETSVDIFSEGGCAASTSDPSTFPILRSYPVDITDGTLDISLPASTNNGKISAIEIISAGPPPECVVDADCDDADACTLDTCNSGSCQSLFDTNECVESFPYDEAFEFGPGIWSNPVGDDFDWSIHSGATATFGTGPSVDHTSGTGSYAYTEATGNTPAQTALLEGPCVELAGMAQATWRFWFHMQGADMGTLHAEVAAGCGATWTPLWSLSGDQGAAWQQAGVDLSAYLGTRVALRFRGVTGASDTSDMAVDDVEIVALTVPPTAVPTDVQMPGTQPHEVGDLAEATDCSLCHQNYNPADPIDEPSHGWGGSMMSHASRDPVFWAALAVADQNFSGSGDLCLRCHVPTGWLGGRSEPTDGSALLATDADGVSCDLCHRLTNPDATEFLGTQNTPFFANDEGAPATGFYGSGQYVVWDQASKLGPYATTGAPHGFAQSTYHRDADMCGTCHDVSNPLVGDLAHNNGVDLPLAPGSFSGVPGAAVDGKAAFNNFPYQYGASERTRSEHAAGLLSQTPISDYATLPAELQAGAIQAARDAALLAGTGGDYDDGTPRTFSCQSCHMRPNVGEGCSLFPGDRDDLPTHDLTGGNYWAPQAIQYLDGLGQLRLGGGLSPTQITQMNSGILRAQQNLSDAGSLAVTGDTLRVVNLTGHKLITGYPEGRRMWLDIKWYDAGNALIEEDGEYGTLAVTIDGQPEQVETLLDPGSTVVYEIHKAMTQEWANQLLGMGVPGTLALTYDRTSGAVVDTLADLAAQAPGTWLDTFHFVFNNHTTKDTRIPPYGMSYDDALQRNALPVPATQYGNPGPGGTYDYWDEVTLAPPVGAHHATIELLYQPTSWEYIQFLYLANDGSNAFLASEGAQLLDAWQNTGMAAPHTMAQTTWAAAACSNTVDDDGDGLVDAADPGCASPDDDTETCGPTDDATCDGIDDDCDGLVDEDFDDANCQDGLYCNGAEACVAGACAAGTAVDCADVVSCTIDTCNEGSDSCDHLPDDGACDNGLFCDGNESCDLLSGCLAGTPPPVDDGVVCTVDGCVEGTGVVNAPNDTLCDDADVCSGVETCDVALDCQPGASLDCNDSDVCTADSCDAITGCGHDPIEGCNTAVPLIPPWGPALLGLLLLAAGVMHGVGRRRGCEGQSRHEGAA